MNRSVYLFLLFALLFNGCFYIGRNTRKEAILEETASASINDLNFSAWAVNQGVALSVVSKRQKPIIVGTQLSSMYTSEGPPLLRSSDLHIHLLKGAGGGGFCIGRHFIHSQDMELSEQVVKANFFIYICNVDDFLEAESYEAVLDVLYKNLYGLSFVWDRGEIKGRLIRRIHSDGGVVTEDPGDIPR